ncbi:MAG: hypothetical protein JXR97_04495 [Planctomycetes bacterium]|nr:hypothetical protein [Planctomycetota bacterium]
MLSWGGQALYTAAYRPMPPELDDAYAYICKSMALSEDPNLKSTAMTDLMSQLEDLPPQEREEYVLYKSMIVTNYHWGYSYLLIALRKCGMSWESGYQLLFIFDVFIDAATVIFVAFVFFGTRFGSAFLLLCSILTNQMGVTQGFHYGVCTHLAFALTMIACCLVGQRRSFTPLTSSAIIFLTLAAVSFHPIGRIGTAITLFFFFLRHGTVGIKHNKLLVAGLAFGTIVMFIAPKFIDSPHLKIITIQDGAGTPPSFSEKIKNSVISYGDALFFWTGANDQVLGILKRHRVPALMLFFLISTIGLLALQKSNDRIVLLIIAFIPPLLADSILYNPFSHGGIFVRVFQWFGIILAGCWLYGIFTSLKSARLIWNKRQAIANDLDHGIYAKVMVLCPIALSLFAAFISALLFIGFQVERNINERGTMLRRQRYELLPEYRERVINGLKEGESVILDQQIPLEYYISTPAALKTNIRFLEIIRRMTNPEKWLDPAKNRTRFILALAERPNLWMNGMRIEPGRTATIVSKDRDLRNYKIRLYGLSEGDTAIIGNDKQIIGKQATTFSLVEKADSPLTSLQISAPTTSGPVILAGIISNETDEGLHWAWNEGLIIRSHDREKREEVTYPLSTRQYEKQLNIQKVKILGDEGSMLLLEIPEEYRK